jgi:hypothetical protein
VSEYRDAPVGAEILEGAQGRLELQRDLRITPLTGATPARSRLGVPARSRPAQLQLDVDRA